MKNGMPVVMCDRLGADGVPLAQSPFGSPFEALIGSWEIDSECYRSDGMTEEATGEWHFARILGGLGVQDVLFAKGAPPALRGTSISGYDAKAGVWRVVWMMPYSGEFACLVSRQVGDEIIQEGFSMDGSSLERWTFSEITGDRFRWRGESSDDGGKTWRLDQQMTGRRMSG
jgi:hypothetical protein